MQSSTFQRLTLFIFSIFTIWLSFYVIQPPEPKPESSPPTEFSAERAFNHIKQIANVPHPLGSAANDSARSYILDELRKMGLEPFVHEGVGIGTRYDRGLAGYTKNIMVTMKGQNPQKTILLMAHYDSTPTTLGAADDGSGTAAILETLRALKAQDKPLKNNVWVLLTDGEERGLLGAEFFVQEFPELQEIDLVLNFEARGTSGPSMMFETNAGNAKLIPHFAEAATHPVANSLMYTVYKLLPNDTDLSVTKFSGLKGLNFAFNFSYLNYHTMQDNPKNLSLASLQHHGSNMLANVRHFGNTNFDIESNTDFVYFNNATGGLMYYPASWSLPLALVTALLFIAYLVFLFRTKQLSVGSYLVSLLLFLGMIILAGLLVFLGWKGIRAFHPQYRWLIQGEVYNHVWYFWAFCSLILGLFTAVYGWVQQKISSQQLISGSFTIWILLSLGTAWYLPTASYIFTWPVLMALIGWIILGDKITNFSWKTTGILAISLSGVLFIIPPFIYLIQIILTTGMLAISMIILVLLLGLAWPMVWQMIRNQKRITIGSLIMGSLACFLIASANAGFDANHKKQNSINYVQNLDTNQAYWVSRDDTTDSWTRQFLSNNYKKGALPEIIIPRSQKVLYKPAKLQKISGPTFEITADSSADSIRHISFQMNAGRGIAMIMRWDESASISAIGIHGKTIHDEQHSKNYLYYFQDLSEPVEFSVSYRLSDTPPSLKLTFLDPGLPTELIPNYKERPDDAMPPPFPVFMSDATVWRTTVNLDEVLASE